VNPKFENTYLLSPNPIQTLLVLIRLQSQLSPKQNCILIYRN